MVAGDDWRRFPRLHEKYPDIGTGPLSVEPYVSAEHFELEREHIFRKSWLIVGRVEEVASPGDYVSIDIAAAGAAVIVVRGRDSAIRAFYNQCSHRSGRVMRAGSGRCKLMQCPYHGWVYDLDGSLRGIPDEKGFFDLDKQRLGLTPVATDVWAGFIFVNFDPQPAVTLAEFMGEFGVALGDYPFEAHADNMAEWKVELNCNWKTIKDAFQEPFHLAFVHHRTIGGIYANPSNPFNYVLDCTLYPQGHHSMSQPGSDTPVEPQGLAKIARDFGPADGQHAASLATGAEEVRFTPGTNPTGNPNWDVDLHGLFPNVTMNTFAGGRYLINFLWPLAHDRTLWIARAYFPKPRNAGERFSYEFNKIFLRDILMEDVSVVEGTQQGMGWGAKTLLNLHEQEIMVRHDHKVIGDIIRKAKEGRNG